jgi:transposase
MLKKPSLMELIPPGLMLERCEDRDGDLVVHARSASRDAACPDCGVVAMSVHGRYLRTLHDLPAHGRRVIIRVTVRRFRCRERACQRRTFAELLASAVDGRYARRTARTDQVVHQIAIALGGRPGERLTARLCLGCSRDTLLRLIRRRAAANDDASAVNVVGIDDWAWRRGRSYGTIICDLESHRVLALLADRHAGSVEIWLAKHPEVTIIARDRGATYARAAARGAPAAVQVADRWHLMANASAAFLDAVRRAMRPIREALGVGIVDLDLLTSVERRQLAGAKRREEANATILSLAEAGVSLKQIVRRTGVSRGTVRRVVRGERSDVFRPRQSSLTRFETMLDRLWTDGRQNGAELHQRLQAAGFKGSLRVVTEWATRRRHDEAHTKKLPRKCPSARTIAKMMTTHRDSDARRQAALLAMIEQAAPDLVTARDQLDAFHAIVRERKPDALDPWIGEAQSGRLASFAAGLKADRPAVEAALRQAWSSGQVEGQINRLKLLKRQMYGRAKADLLEARLVNAA